MRTAIRRFVQGAAVLFATCALTLSAPARPAAAPGEIRIALVGQALIKSDLRAESPDAIAQARAYLAGADATFTNLEVSIAVPGVPVTPRTRDTVYAEPPVLDALRTMGFDLLSLANNHAWDLLEPGMLATRDLVARSGFGHAGTGRSVDEAAAPGLLRTPRGDVALVAMASGGVQLTPDAHAGPDKAGVNYLAVDADGRLDPTQRGRVLTEVRKAAARGALVIAYHHNHVWGPARGVDGPPGRERRIDRFVTPKWMETWARELVDAGAHVFVAHGNPALHGVEVRRGRLILYGLGNYVFQSRNDLDRFGPLAYQSVVVHATFRRGRVHDVRFTPLVLGMADRARGVPYRAQGGEALAIFGRLEDLSRPYGTRIRFDEREAVLVSR
jgi:poly-gamma-glutamate synthesis protein (capsule biosynthesis protein)